MLNPCAARKKLLRCGHNVISLVFQRGRSAIRIPSDFGGVPQCVRRLTSQLRHGSNVAARRDRHSPHDERFNALAAARRADFEFPTSPAGAPPAEAPAESWRLGARIEPIRARQHAGGRLSASHDRQSGGVFVRSRSGLRRILAGRHHGAHAQGPGLRAERTARLQPGQRRHSAKSLVSPAASASPWTLRGLSPRN